MKSLIYKIFFLLLSSLTLAACSDDEPGDKGNGKKNRTVLVYMVADNNLGVNYALDTADTNEMLKAALQGDIGDGHLLVYHNRPGTNSGKAPQLVEITPDGKKVLKTYVDDPNVYSVEIDRMREVLEDMKNYAPADGYGLILWGHATGWMTEKNDMDRSYGNDRNKWMSLTSLGKALEGNYFDFIYMDCCLMGSIEVSYELRYFTPLFVGSPTEVEGEGMPYHLNIKPLFAERPDVVAAAENTFKYYDGMPGRKCQMVVVDTGRLDELAMASRDIYATVTEFPQALDDVQYLSKLFDPYTQPYTNCRPVSDFESYMHALGASNPQLLARWQSIYDSCILYKASTAYEYNNIPVKTFGGLGVFAIKRQSDITYRGYVETQWWTDVASVMPACMVK